MREEEYVLTTMGGCAAAELPSARTVYARVYSAVAGEHTLLVDLKNRTRARLLTVEPPD